MEKFDSGASIEGGKVPYRDPQLCSQEGGRNLSEVNQPRLHYPSRPIGWQSKSRISGCYFLVVVCSSHWTYSFQQCDEIGRTQLNDYIALRRILWFPFNCEQNHSLISYAWVTVCDGAPTHSQLTNTDEQDPFRRAERHRLLQNAQSGRTKKEHGQSKSRWQNSDVLPAVVISPLCRFRRRSIISWDILDMMFRDERDQCLSIYFNCSQSLRNDGIGWWSRLISFIFL